MKCTHIATELSAYLDGEVTPAARVEIEAHLGERCRPVSGGATAATPSGVTAQPQAQFGPRFLAEVRAKIRGAEPAVEKPQWFDLVFRPSG